MAQFNPLFGFTGALEHMRFDLSRDLVKPWNALKLVPEAGGRTHLNDLISGYPRLPIRIVEWAGAGNSGARHFYWDGLFPKRTHLTSLESILSFKDWGA